MGVRTGDEHFPRLWKLGLGTKQVLENRKPAA